MDNQMQLVHAKLIDLHARFLALEDAFLAYVNEKDGVKKAGNVEKQIDVQHLQHLKNLVLLLHEQMPVDPVLDQMLTIRQHELAADF